MKYAAYSQYSPSASIWLDRLPSHWQQLRVKHVIDRMESGVSVNAEASPAQPGEVGVLKTSCVYGDQFQPSENKRVLEDELDRVACRVKADRLVISRMNTPDLVGSCGYVPQDYPDLYLPDRLWQTFFNPARRCLPRYAWYYLTSRPAKSAISSLAAGTSGSMQNIAQDAFMGISFPLPPLDEQRSIVRFLDAKTAQIDALIAKKRQFIEKLKEKRQALIARTVTRGLPPEAAKAVGLEPNPAMTDSGVEWLGMVPASWSAKKLKRCGYLIAGAGFPHEHQGQEGEELPFYKVADLGQSADGVTLSSSEHTVSRETAALLRAKVVPAGSIAYAKIGAALLLNRRRITSVDCCIDNNMSAFVPRSGLISTRWAYYFLSIIDFSEFMNPGAIPSFSEGYQADLPILLPPLREQEAICTYLSAATSEIDSMVAAAETAADRLLECRQAVIASAVTGKIDVREPA